MFEQYVFFVPIWYILSLHITCKNNVFDYFSLFHLVNPLPMERINKATLLREILPEA